MATFDIVVVGGGIAGLATAYHLGRAGRARVCLVEGEACLASHSSGRNAAIYRPVDEMPSTAQLAMRSRQLIDALSPRERLCRPTGLLLVSATPEPVDDMCRLGRAHGIDVERAEGEALHALHPQLRGGEARHGAWLPGGGVLDLHAIHMALARGARAAGVQILVGVHVRSIELQVGRVAGLYLTNSQRVSATQVVLAAGAWNEALGASCGARLSLQPIRRHLVQLEAEVPEDWPVLWRLDNQVYFRPESRGILASPCDETPFEACGDPPTSNAALEVLVDKLQRTAPRLMAARVRRSWAGLRTFTSDQEMVVGPDPRVPGLFWFGGLGGRGMSIGMAVGERLAQAVLGDVTALPEVMLPRRLLVERVDAGQADLLERRS